MGQWTCWDSNPRPPHCKWGILPTELQAHEVGLMGLEPTTTRLSAGHSTIWATGLYKMVPDAPAGTRTPVPGSKVREDCHYLTGAFDIFDLSGPKRTWTLISRLTVWRYYLLNYRSNMGRERFEPPVFGLKARRISLTILPTHNNIKFQWECKESNLNHMLPKHIC